LFQSLNTASALLSKEKEEVKKKQAPVLLNPKRNQILERNNFKKALALERKKVQFHKKQKPVPLTF
jgi:hypothetical protein